MSSHPRPVDRPSAAMLRSFALGQGIPVEDLPVRDPDPDRRLPLDGAFNFRDIGGYATSDGRQVRKGRVFRSDHLNELTDRDRAALLELDIRVIHDFRLDVERDRQPSALGAHAYEVVLLTMSDTTQLDVSMIEMVRDALAGRRPLPPRSFWADSYGEMLDVARPMFVTLFASLAGEERLPALYHCSGGKDRTGLATAMLLRLLGVDDATIIDDFLLTNLYRTPIRLSQVRAEFERLGVDPYEAAPIMGVTRGGIERALTDLDRRGGVRAYLVDAGLDPASLDVLCRELVENAPA